MTQRPAGALASRTVPDCHVCDQNARPDLPPRERVVLTEHWRVAHAFDSSLPGWLVLDPLRHVTALDELAPEAHGEMGLLLGRLSAALRAELGCVKTYVMLFAEAAGFGHLHVHLVPRMADQPADALGAGVFRFLGADEDTRVPATEMDDLARRIAARLEPA